MPLSVAAGGSAQVEFSHTFAANAERGIYHVDYELLDAGGVVLQPVAETDSGRIVVAAPPSGSSYHPPDLTLGVTAPEGEQGLVDAPMHFRYRLENKADISRTFRIYAALQQLPSTVVAELTLLPHETVERDLYIPLVIMFRSLWLDVFEQGGQERFGRPTSRIPPTEDWAFQLTRDKGFFGILARAQVSAPDVEAMQVPGATVPLQESRTASSYRGTGSCGCCGAAPAES